jgi:hypothetical protein
MGAISLWLTPFDGTRLIGYITSIVFAGDAYVRGITLLQQAKRNDELEGIRYDAGVDFYDALTQSQIDSYLEVKALEIETQTIKRLIPLIQQKTQLERQLDAVSPIHPEMSEEDRFNAAKSAVDSAFVEPESKSDRSEQITEEDIRKQFSEAMDGTYWKAILKALGNGATKHEIIKDVLGCNPSAEKVGGAYFDYLKAKYME